MSQNQAETDKQQWSRDREEIRRAESTKEQRRKEYDMEEDAAHESYVRIEQKQWGKEKSWRRVSTDTDGKYYNRLKTEERPTRRSKWTTRA